MDMPTTPKPSWLRESTAPSLAEVFRSVAVPQNAGFMRKAFAFLGPGFLVSVGYMDPGNWATSIAAGAKFGYALLWVALLSNIMAIILQHLAASRWQAGAISPKPAAMPMAGPPPLCCGFLRKSPSSPLILLRW